MSPNSLAVQWLGLHAPTVGSTGSIPAWGMKTLHGALHGKKKKKEKRKSDGLSVYLANSKILEF